MKINSSHYRLLFLTAFAIVYSGFASFTFTENSAAQKIADGVNSRTGKLAPEAGTIQGTVYIDFNMNGARNMTGIAPDIAVDDGIAGVTVTAYAANGASVATVTAADGTYSLVTTALPAGPYRVEFTGLPNGYSPSYFGTNNGSTVRFVSDGSQSGIDLGILNPVEEYCQNSPDIAIPRWQNGDPTGNSTPSITTVPWGTLSRTTSANTNVSTVDEIGTTWATAYKRDTKRLFTSAFLRRHSGFGSRGVGGVYILNFAAAGVPLEGSISLQGVTATNGGTIDLGSVSRDLVAGDIANGPSGDNDLGSPEYPNRDLDVFNKVGKMSFGDAEFEANMRYLWLVNLNQRALIRIDTSVPINLMAATARQHLVVSGASSATSIGGAPTCPNGIFRPFAIKFRLGLGYVGGTCTAELGGGTAVDLSAHILSFDPTSGTPVLTPVISVPLTYTREARESESSPMESTWVDWRSTWSGVMNGNTEPDSALHYNSNAAPLLSNIEFTQNGSIVLGIMDRVSAQIGNNNYIAESNSTQLYDKKSAGDINMVCRVGAGWEVEGTGSCVVQDNTPFTTEGPNDYQIVADSDGLGNGGEFFWADMYYFAGNSNGGGHGEVALGALLTYPGSDQVVTTAFDPVIPEGNVNHFNSQGLIYFNTVDGSRVGYPATPDDNFNSMDGGGYLMVQSTDTSADLGKSLGLGEPDLLCNAAPLQIGNRVWRDADFDDVQDPGELPIAGVTINLYDSNGILVATAVTNSNGEYYFVGGTAADSDPTDLMGVLNGDILTNSTYQIRIDNPLDYQIGGALFGNMLTRPNTAGQAGEDELSDSDGVLTLTGSGTYPAVTVNTGGAGANTHVYDFGFVLVPLSGDATVSGRVFTANGSPIRNATVVLTESNGTIHRFVTGSFGHFTFTEVNAGQTVLIDVSAGKRNFREPTILVTVGGDVSGINFYADELR